MEQTQQQELQHVAKPNTDKVETKNSGVPGDTKKVTQINLYDEKAALLLQGLTLSSCQPDSNLLVDLQESIEPVSAWQQGISV